MISHSNRGVPNNRAAAVALDGFDPAEILAAKAAGMTVVAWRAAGRPVAITAPRQKPKGPVRAWHPYRSKWEQAYARHLDFEKWIGDIADFSYEPEKLEIGIGAVYTPDFRVTMTDGAIEFHEVKGYRREAAMVRIKAAALRYPDRRFVLVTKVGGEWKHTPIGAKP